MLKLIDRSKKLSLFFYPPVVKKFYEKYPLKIMGSEETVKALMRGKSLVRFGEGEIQIITASLHHAVHDIYFQKGSDKLGKDLLEVLQFKDPKFMLGLPGCFSSKIGFSHFTTRAKSYWLKTVAKNLPTIARYLSPSILYADACVSRPFLDTQDRKLSEFIFNSFKRLVSGRKVLLIEGEGTRFGVGNDLLSSAEKVQRILVPAINAYDKVDEIFELASAQIEEMGEKTLVLLAAGPAAKILAYKIFIKNRVQVIDAGHLDIEYEWFKTAATRKIPVKGKFVNEARSYDFQSGLGDEVLTQYKSQVIKKII